ncbi:MULTISPECIES: oligosaccharide flippase family protein [unclassified Shewanella]|uniref:oligosaccharide flippase family protein n=1 Tax=unclassified Shewanella TaxID=196818 RepID=UPI001BC22469|nr:MULTISPECIES: oligosaccharide flippase family protein [unclassified Shewanella]GIU18130.1 lipopolysaccharide biosynthesis protein [Shewanella sp. MBTL60-112-B1]GIU38955.1 lipopolysaccharide biosynthesis protein [Shewanella sp. MBTL60-112-B2]
MQSYLSYRESISTALNGALAKGLFWLGSAQVLGRIVRLGSSIIIARLLTPEVFGQVAIILTCFEIICTPTRRISSAALIKMDDSQVKQSLHAANRVNWLAAIIAFVAMSLLSWPLAIYYDNLQLILPMILMATSYLLLPFGMLYAAVNLRLNRMRVVGRAVLWQTVFDALLTASFALLGLGIWAIILPKVIVVFIWIGVHRYHNPLPETLSNDNFHRLSQENQWQLLPAKSKAILKFGLQVGFGDLAIVLRQNIDYILVGYFLGIEALGVYFFAFNASLGISLGLVQSYGTALYSYLCQKDQTAESTPLTLEQKYFKSLKFIMLLTVPVISLQALLAPLYVPWVYGQKWLDAGALPVFILLCLSGLVRPLGEAASQYLISAGRSQFNLLYNSCFTLILAVTIAISSIWGLQAVALGILLSHLFVMPSFTLYLKLTQSITDTAHYRSEARYDS